MKKKRFLLLLGMLMIVSASVFGQGRANDIPVSRLPNEVKEVLGKYIALLQTANDLDECATLFTAIAGGALVNEDVEDITLRQSVKPYSLKKDFQNVKFYANPIKITRVNLSSLSGTGFGESAIGGKVYKIWIGKKAGVAGMPAPISIMVPENHPSIKTPKVIGIGSL